MSRWMGWMTVAVLFLLAAPVVAGTTFVRHYEASSTYAYRDGYVGGAFCTGGQDTLADTGACVAYHVPGVVDFRGRVLVVEIIDLAFGADTWGVVAIDVDGDGRVDCTIDPCAEGQGSVVVTVPIDATGRYVRVFPATIHSPGVGGIPDGFATAGEVRFTFS